MARGRKLFIAGIVAVCLAGVAMAEDSTDDDFSKKEIKQCYKDNPGCTGECYDELDDGNLVCAVPADEDPATYDLCGGTKKNSNWQVWDDDDATAACTCADGYVTSAKVVENWGDSDGFPKASKLCTIDCGEGNVTCEEDDDDVEQNQSGPLSCYCTDGTGDKYAEKELEQELKEEVDTFFEELKSEIKEAYLDDKEIALEDKEDAKADAKELTDEAKDELDTIKSDYKTDMDELHADWKEAKEAVKNGEEFDETDYERLRTKLKTLKKAAAKKAAKAKPAAPVAPAAKVAAAAPAKKPVA